MPKKKGMSAEEQSAFEQKKADVLFHLNNANTYSSTNVTFKDLEKIAKKILSKKGEDRNTELTKAYISLSKRFDKKCMPQNIRVNANSEYFTGDYDSIRGYCIAYSTQNARTVIEKTLDLLSPGYTKDNPFTDKMAEDIRDYEMATIKSQTFASNIKWVMKEWTMKHYEADASDFGDMFNKSKQHTYGGNIKNYNDVAIAEGYLKLKIAREEFKKHGLIWRYRHPLETQQFKDYIEIMEERLKRLGFDEKEHGERAIAMVNETLSDPMSIHIELTNIRYTEAVSSYRKKYTAPTTIAIEKINKGKAFEENPNSSFKKMFEPMLNKYGFDKNEEFISLSGMEKAAEQYDSIRLIDGYKREIVSTFDGAFKKIVAHALKNGKPFDAYEILNDARKITVAAIQQYTNMFDSKEYSELKQPMYFKHLEKSWFESSFRTIQRQQKITLSKRAVKSMTEALVSVFSDWEKDPEAILGEDKNLGKEYEKNLIAAQRKAENSSVNTKTITAEEKELGNKMLEINFRPDAANIQHQNELMNSISSMVKNSNLSPEAKRVFTANQNKIRQMKVVANNPDGQKSLNDTFAKAEEKLKADYADYKPVNMDNVIEGLKGKEPIIIDGSRIMNDSPVKSNNVNKIEPILEKNPLEKNSIKIN